MDAAKDADVLCLQEVTADSADWLQRALGSVFDVVTPTHCGRAWQGEQHGVAVAVRKAAFHCQKPRLHLFTTSEQQRSLLTVELAACGGGPSLLVGTAHMESEQANAEARQRQMEEACELMRSQSVDGAILAGDFNMRDTEAAAEAVAAEWGQDAWTLAGSPESSRRTWPASGASGEGHRYDRILVRRDQAAVVAQNPFGDTLELRENSFALLQHRDTDHAAVRCVLDLREGHATQKRRRRAGLGEPLRAKTI